MSLELLEASKTKISAEISSELPQNNTKLAFIESLATSRKQNKMARGNPIVKANSQSSSSQIQDSCKSHDDHQNNNSTTQQDLSPQTSLKSAQANEEFKPEFVWRNIIAFIILHTCIPLTIYLVYTQRCWKTLAYSFVCMYISGLGITGGAHRLWSHRAYKAKWPIQALLMCWQTMAGQNSIYTWSRDHRCHHKFAETNADPHNINRGFFFAHMGWLCVKKHPDVIEKGKLIDLSDLEANPWVMFQHRHFWWLAIVMMVLLPASVPVVFWQESLWTSFVIAVMFRYTAVLHGTWLVNSAAHYSGWRPYDVNIAACESPYAIFYGLGEGFHNYHHTFPFDYATSEFGRFWNLTTAFIDLSAKLGLVMDRRTVDKLTIQRRKIRTGELKDHHHKFDENDLIKGSVMKLL